MPTFPLQRKWGGLPNIYSDAGDIAGFYGCGKCVRSAVKIFFEKIKVEWSTNLDNIMELYDFATCHSPTNEELIAPLLQLIKRTVFCLNHNVDFHNIPPIKLLYFNYTTIYIKLQFLQKSNKNITGILHLIKYPLFLFFSIDFFLIYYYNVNVNLYDY